MTRRRDRGTGERGGVAVEWALGIALLVLPVVMLVSVLPTWAERQSMARLAAREAARVTALSGEEGGEGAAAGVALALEIAANSGVRDDEVAVRVDVPADTAGEPLREGVVSATVEVAVPLVTVPGFGAIGGWTITATHHEPLDRYRSIP